MAKEKYGVCEITDCKLKGKEQTIDETNPKKICRECELPLTIKRRYEATEKGPKGKRQISAPALTLPKRPTKKSPKKPTRKKIGPRK